MRHGNATPINKTAALVVGRGEHFEPSVDNSTRVHSDVPLRLKKPGKAALANPSYEDLTGLKKGRVTVMGLSADVPKRWVVRCACGAYEFRTARKLKRENDEDMCAFCNELERIKHRYSLGKRK